MYQGFRLNLGKSSKINIFDSLLTTFEISNIFWVALVLSLKSNQEVRKGLAKLVILLFHFGKKDLKKCCVGLKWKRHISTNKFFCGQYHKQNQKSNYIYKTDYLTEYCEIASGVGGKEWVQRKPFLLRFMSGERSRSIVSFFSSLLMKVMAHFFILTIWSAVSQQLVTHQFI